jgi:hypothetical protein
MFENSGSVKILKSIKTYPSKCELSSLNTNYLDLRNKA